MGVDDPAACDMAGDDQKQHDASGGATTIASRVASICAMIDDAASTTMSARQVAAISAMIHDVAAAAEAGSMTMPTSGRRRKRRMGSARSYEDVLRLGKGAFGSVDKARHHSTGQTVALKSLRRTRRPEVLAALLLREACFMAACRGHPSVVGLRGVARAPGTRNYSIVMEYVGPSLDDVLHERVARRGRPFPEDQVRRVMRQLLAGAEAMHKHRIIHGDIKPANILVVSGSDDVVKIGDYGLALSMDEQDREYYPAGTIPYMPPEVLLEKPDYDTLVDQWSLGCVMAELLTGKVLFDGEDEDDTLYKIFDLLRVPGKKAWKAFKPSVLDDEVQRWRRAQQQQGRHCNRLRVVFPEKLLSEDGFDVLQGLLTCDPNKRLDAAAVLRLPWFADTNGDDVAAVPAASKNGIASLWQMALSCAGRALELVRPKPLLKCFSSN